MASVATKAATCTVCGIDFPSRNKLFVHLTDSGHGALGSDDRSGAPGAANGDGRGNDSSASEPQLAKGNDSYHDYYLRQKICSSEEWEEAYRRLRTPLPVSYRVHESSPMSGFAANILELVGGMGESNGTGDGTAPVDKQPMFEEWALGAEGDAKSAAKLRMMISSQCHRRNKSKRSNRSKEDDDVSSILHALQELGAIHRQELVSAIPPLVLWSASNETDANNSASIVADLCAAPGSKSLQLLDLLHASSDGTIPPGLLVVNDADRNRIVTLCQRSRHVPRAPMLAINMDARYFPGMRRRCKSNGNHAGMNAVGVLEKAGYKQKYDKVLCDVPCSGDGTTRKNNQVWNAWSLGHAMSLHRLQRKILRRGMELLRPGGMLVYSTCSLNPLENEAVVASVIGDVGGTTAMEIVPLPDWAVQKCGAQVGLTTWQVPHPKFGKKGNADMYCNFEDVPIEHQGGEGKGKKGGQINRSMFPPEADTELSKQLRHCGRFLPNPQLDSGGFFVACIKRLQVGELGVKERTPQAGPVVPSQTADDPVASNATSRDGNNPNTAGQPKSSSTSPSGDEMTPTTNVELREGDWICTSCKEVNFGRRGGSRCFGCKARKPKSKEENGKISQPLLSQPQPVLDSFFEYFGIATGPESTLPKQNAHVIRRVKEHTIVLVSDALSRLAISESWSPVREVGISLAAFPSESRGQADFRLIAEGLPILALHATRRHFKLQPAKFRIALAQSVGQLLTSSAAAEVERIKGTLGRTLKVVDTLLDSNGMWYETLGEDSMMSEWAQCEATPGYFIVSCECKFPRSEGSTLSFCGCIDVQGGVTVVSSLRLVGAMLVLMNKYHSEVMVCTDDPPIKRRRT